MTKSKGFFLTAFLVGGMLPGVAKAAPSDELGNWWNNSELMRLRDAYIEQEVQFVEDFSSTTQSGYVSVPEWRCVVAENSFSGSDTVPWLNPRYSDKVQKLLAMRLAWQREVVHFFCLGAEIGEEFSVSLLEERQARYRTQRVDWRPSHLLPGPKAPCPVPSPITGITDNWWAVEALQTLRSNSITMFLAQIEALANVLSDTDENPKEVRLALLQGQHRGLSEVSRLQGVTTDPLEHRHYISAMELMRGFQEELRLHIQFEVPVAGRWSPQDFESALGTKNMPYRIIYRTLDPEYWRTIYSNFRANKIPNFKFVEK